MNTCKKIVFLVFLYSFTIGLVSAVQLTPNPVNPSSRFNILTNVYYEYSLEPVNDSNVTYVVVSGTGINCAAQTYPQNQKLNFIAGAQYCTGANCLVGTDDPTSSSTSGNYTVCINASKAGFRSSYASAVLNVSATTCGNGVKDSGETCRSCPTDAGCIFGQLCCDDGTCKSSCVPIPSCVQNGICESFETCNCQDCVDQQDGCFPGDICSGSTQVCGCNPFIDGICPLSDFTCANQDPDCASEKTGIFVVGDPSNLNVYWNSSGMSQPPQNIGMECYLNCDPRISPCGTAQQCTYVGPSVSNICQIQPTPPNYIYDTYDWIICRIYEPETNRTYNYFEYRFKPYDVDLSVSSFSVTVGQDFSLPVTIKNIGLFTDSFQINVSQNHLIYMPFLSQTTEVLSGIPLINAQQLLFNMKVLAMTDSPIGVLVTVNSTTNSTHGKALYIQLKSGSASLPEYDIFGVLQLLLISSAVFTLLVWKKK